VPLRLGGIYVDSDMLLLRDLTPLCNSTFVYQWWGCLYKSNRVVTQSA
jgi:mannosyltransferase OCH1-like enzyme